MGEIVPFCRKANGDENVKFILLSIKRNLDKYLTNNNCFKDDKSFIEMFSSTIKTIVEKLDINGWKSPSIKKRFVDVYNYINSNACDNDFLEQYDKMFYDIILVSMTNIYPYILDHNDEYLFGMIKGINQTSRYSSIQDPLLMREFLKVLDNRKLMQLIMIDGEDLIPDNVEDVCNFVLNGTELKDIINIYESPDGSVDDINKGIVTIDRIKNYYNYITDLIYSHELEVTDNKDAKENLLADYNDYKNTFDRIEELRFMDEKSQLNYIYYVSQIRGKINNSIFDELSEIQALTNLYLTYQSQLFGINSDAILPLVSIISEKQITKEEVDKFVLRLEKEES